MKRIRLRILDRYVGTEFVKTFLLSLFGLVFILTMYNVLENLRIETKQDRAHIYFYVLYSIPQLTAIILPNALMFSVCFTVAQFTVSREMVAIHSAGMSFYRAVTVILLAGPLLSIVLFLFQNYVVTPANAAAANEMEIIKKGTGTVKDLVWQKNLRGVKGFYFIYFFDRPNNRIVGGFNYLEMDGNNPLRMYQANKAAYREATRDWLLTSVRIVEFDADLRVKKAENRAEFVISLPDEVEFFSSPSLDPSELDISELSQEIERRERLGFTTVPYRVQWHANIAYPVMCVIVSIVGAIAGGMGSLRSGGPLIRSLIISIGTMFVYLVTFRLGQSFGSSGLFPPPLAAWGPTSIFMILAGLLIWKNKK